jgi:hypothetical protein
VDYAKTNAWRVAATIMREREDGGLAFKPPAGHAGAEFVVYRGRTFLWNGNASCLYELVDGTYVPRLTWQQATVDVTETRGGEETTRGVRRHVYWIDDNNDGRVQDGEVRKEDLVPPGCRANMWLGVPVDHELGFYFPCGPVWANQGGRPTEAPFAIRRWACAGFNADGGLVYAPPSDMPVVAEDRVGAISSLTVDRERNLYVLVANGSLPRGQRAQGSGHRVVKFAPDGSKQWEYHNVHCAFAWTSEAYTPGYLVGVLRFVRGGTDTLIGVTGYYGQYFLLDRRTGLFVDALGEDQRSPYTLDHRMVLTENFNGTLFEDPRSGRTYFSGGDADARIWELTGLDSMDRRTATVEVSAAAAAQAARNALQAARSQAAALGRKVLTVVRLEGAGADGAYDEWTAVPPQTIVLQEGRGAMFQAGYDDAALYLRFQVTDDSPLRNTGADYRLLFKTGDALDIQLGTDLGARAVHGQNQQRAETGDTRILVSRSHDDDMLATVIRYRTAEREKPDRYVYESPVWKQPVDAVVQAAEIGMHCRAGDADYVVEVAVPWQLLGVRPESGLVLLGDAGVIFGNRGGTKNAIRYLWADWSAEVSINNDIPSEVRVHPNDWGRWVLE